MERDDMFRPKSDPARAIYDAFQAEAQNRRSRSVEEWKQCEREVILREATVQAGRLSLQPPTMDDVIAADNYAVGSIDYGSKLAYKLVEIMRMGTGGP